MSAKKNVLFVLIFFPLIISAQIDTAIVLREVRINSVRSEKNTVGLKTGAIDSLTRLIASDRTLGNYLDESTPALVKNYGPGALSSVSLRGGSAYHTAVLWKGFSIANPMNGVMDFNLLPVFLFDEVSVQYGGSSSLWGSGAVSGVIQLSNNLGTVNGNSLKAGIRYSTNSGLTDFAELKFRKSRFSSTVKLFSNDEKNEFTFRQSGQLKKQVHAQAKGHGIISENSFTINSTTSLNFNFWYQYSDRNIAPVLTESISDAVQKDRNYRYNLSFIKTGNRGKFIFRNAYFNESLNYQDSTLINPSSSLCKTFISEPEYAFTFNENHSLQAGINLTVINAIATEFKKEAEVIRKAIYIGYHFTFKKLLFSASARKEINNQEEPPVAFTTGIKYKLLQWLKVYGSYSTVYRNPQINDLYWQPGGNINLLPETGSSVEGTIEINLLDMIHRYKSDTNSLNLSVTGFNKNIDNWIAWTPHGILWTPSNIKSVHSFGSETSLSYKKLYRKTGLKISGFYGYNVSETTASLIAFDNAVGKQLIYVPLHKAGGTLSILYKRSALTISQIYTGVRYTTTDNSGYLMPFEKTNIQFDQYIEINRASVFLFVRTENLFNTEYQSVLNRPQPLRSFAFGITVNYKQKNKS